MKKALAVAALVASVTPSGAEESSSFYAGVTVGTGSGDIFVPASSSTFDLDGEAYGLFFGTLTQRGKLAYGGEIAFQSTDIAIGGFDGQSIDQLFDLKGRLGYVAGSALVYGVLGYSTFDIAVPAGSTSGDGLSYGVGVDFMANEKFMIGAEYLYRNLENDFDFPVLETEPDLSTFSLRVGMKF